MTNNNVRNSVKKKALIVGSAAIIAGSSLSTLPALAQGSNNQPQQKNIFEIIAEKFGLKKGDVQKVVQDHHKQKAEERLNKAVEDGKITEDQKKKIIEKMEDNFKFRESLKDKSPEERKEAIKKHREEMKKWAEENKIPIQFIMPHPHRGGMRPPKNQNPENSQQNAQPQSEQGGGQTAPAELL